MTDTGMSKIGAEQVANSISSYTGDDYGSIRDAQSKGIQEGWEAQDGRNIENYIDKAPKYTKEIYRGIQNDAFKEEIISGKIKVGDTIDMRGTSSWSSDPSSSSKFGNIIFISSDTPKATAIAHLSGRTSEKEVLVSKDTKFNISKIETYTGWPTSEGKKYTRVYIKGGL